MNDNNLHKEIDLIQGCINRMANNSFLLRGWSITIIAAVIAIARDKVLLEPLLLLCGVLIPLLCFWYLDTFFLHTEEMYRKMYEWVLDKRKSDDLEYQYDLNPHRFNNEVDSFCKVMFSKTLRVFYGIPVFVVFAVILYQLLKEPFCKWICGC